MFHFWFNTFFVRDEVVVTSNNNGSLSDTTSNCIRTVRALSYDEQAITNNYHNHHSNDNEHQHNSDSACGGEPRPRETR